MKKRSLISKEVTATNRNNTIALTSLIMGNGSLATFVLMKGEKTAKFPELTSFLLNIWEMSFPLHNMGWILPL